MSKNNAFDIPIYDIASRISNLEKQARNQGTSYVMNNDDWRYLTQLLETNVSILGQRAENFKMSLDQMLEILSTKDQKKNENQNQNKRSSYFV